MAKDKEKAFSLAATIKQIEKTFGAGAIMHLDASSEIPPIDVVSTGSLSLDLALGVGGLPRGRVVEIYGLESSGKTTLALHCIAEAQKLGGKCAFIDSEHALDPAYAQRLGINIRELLISQPDYGEQALDIAEKLISSGAVAMVVIDSVAALVPKAEIEGSIEDQQPGMQARLMSKALRRMASVIHRTNTIVIFINQIRHKIGVIYGNPETTSGGNALKFYSSVRLEVRPIVKIKSGDQFIGLETRVKVVKNKVAPPFQNTVLKLMYGCGISWFDDVLLAGLKTKVLDRAGAWFSYKGVKLGQGAEQSKTFLKQNPAVVEEICKDVFANKNQTGLASDKK